MSHIRRMEKGTPQGSSLSGPLFSIYINNISSVLKNCKCILYADDLVLWCSSVSVLQIQEMLENYINQLREWCHFSYMKINVLKTKSMLVSAPRKHDAILNLTVGNESIIQVSEFTYLDVILDDKLSWNEQFESVSSKMTQRAYLINRHKKSLSQKWLQTIISSIVMSVLDYCLPA
jgi:hypothetical protein